LLAELEDEAEWRPSAKMNYLVNSINHFSTGNSAPAAATTTTTRINRALPELQQIRSYEKKTTK